MGGLDIEIVDVVSIGSRLESKIGTKSVNTALAPELRLGLHTNKGL